VEQNPEVGGALEGWVKRTTVRFGEHLSRRHRRKIRSNAMRGTALETAYGCTGGGRLWRAQPQERIRHETRPIGAVVDKSVEGSRKPEDASVGVRQTPSTCCCHAQRYAEGVENLKEGSRRAYIVWPIG
jgi:hypothetical protein